MTSSKLLKLQKVVRFEEVDKIDENDVIKRREPPLPKLHAFNFERGKVRSTFMTSFEELLMTSLFQQQFRSFLPDKIIWMRAEVKDDDENEKMKIRIEDLKQSSLICKSLTSHLVKKSQVFLFNVLTSCLFLLLFVSAIVCLCFCLSRLLFVFAFVCLLQFLANFFQFSLKFSNWLKIF